VPDDETVIRTAGRFRLAWIAATKGDPLPATDPAVVEAHEVANALIRVTGAADLRGAYEVVDALVLPIKRAQRTP